MHCSYQSKQCRHLFSQGWVTSPLVPTRHRRAAPCRSEKWRCDHHLFEYVYLQGQLGSGPMVGCIGQHACSVQTDQGDALKLHLTQKQYLEMCTIILME